VFLAENRPGRDDRALRLPGGDYAEVTTVFEMLRPRL
jgi:hypothetical protein